MQFRRIGSIALHFRHIPARGGKPLIAFINSLGTDFRIWEAVSGQFADHPVLLYDKRGHGLSDIGHPPYLIEDHVDDLCGLVDHIGASEVVLCGVSVGGLIAQGFAARRPEAVRALILCDTAHKIGTAEFWDTRISAVHDHGIEAIADSVLERWFTPPLRADAARLSGYRNMLIRQPVEGYAGTCAAVRDADYTEAARRITAPALCLVGDQDGSTPPDLVRSLAALIPNSRFEIIAGAGHIPSIEQPAALTELIREFLAGIGKAGA
ncbi:3-oxoadipate enol-lactonase [Pseudaminobacter sp. 19-2017]|uniref:3-oxoadipate enol-lactonase n=1 Tax=Pseudaminobacter soli (ex Zhang et al. 2022) TaxID=2831468 RepID=A0A942DZE4_9HYPH|nr:3-oxoadipate enol-lactonase [Pseudaminobacter soli]MBS3648323.1 3-oxoadipate enol-lactonase [Pseudaminobacter soli]